jgi:prephenate dehydrogenase
MGAMLARRLEYAGCLVRGADRPLTESALRQACSGAEAVLLCVPVPAMEETARAVAPRMEPGAVLADIASVKVAPVRAMEKYHPGPVVGTHPLFGPDPAPGEMTVCVTPGGRISGDGSGEQGEAAARKMEALFRSMGCSTFRRTPEEHDRAMAFVQGLNFITSAAYFAMLSRHEEMLPFLTPSFRRRMEAARTMLTRDAEMFSLIFENNPFSQDMVREYRAFLNVAAGGDVDVLISLARWWFEGGSRGKTGNAD